MEPRLKRLPAIWETWVRSLGRKDLLENEMATHSSVLAWKIPWTERLGGLQSTGCKQSDTTERLHLHFDEDCRVYMCVCFNSVICVAIFDGHFACLATMWFRPAAIC